MKAMINMKMTKKEMVETNPVDAMLPADQPNYPYGLKVRLCNDDLDKLGFNIGNHKVGEIGELEAKFVIESMESRKTDQGEEKEVCLQLTDLGFKDKEERLSFEGRR
jgi:hypothetical protein